MAILGNWVGRTGARHTTPGTIHELCVKVDAHAGIDRVEFWVQTNTAAEPRIADPNLAILAGLAPTLVVLILINPKRLQ